MCSNENGDIYCNDYGNDNSESPDSFANSKNKSKSINVGTNTNQDKTLSLETVTSDLSSMMVEDLRIESTTTTAGAAANSADHKDVRGPFGSSSALQPERRVPTAACLDSSKDYGSNNINNNSNSNSNSNKIEGNSTSIHPSNLYQSKSTRPQNRRLRTRPNHDHDHNESLEHDHRCSRMNQMKEPPPYSASTAPNCGTINRKNNEHYPKMKLSRNIFPKPLSTLSHFYETHSQQKQQLSQNLERVLKPSPSHSLSLPSSSSSILPSLSSPPKQRKDSSTPRAIDVSPEANRTISPISFSSSMFRKKKLTAHHYPSMDSIEKQICETLQDPLSVDASLPSISARDTTPNGTKGNQVEASSSIQANPLGPKKLLRVDSLYHSSLQQQQHQQQQQPTRPQEYQHPSHTIPHQHQMQQHAFPCPLPVGNGITNGTATRIHYKANASEKIPIAAQQQEYELKASPPSLSKRKPKPQHQHQQKDGIVNTNSSNVRRYRKNPHASINDKIPKPSRSALRPLSKSKKAVKVEVYPDVFQVLRDSKEFVLAKERNFVVSCICIVCKAKSLCVADAAYTICPACYAVHPLKTSPPTAVTTTSNISREQSIKKSHHDDTTISDDSRWGVSIGSLVYKGRR
mmetsp:Transcript_20901/g.45504  ORF Transcript_20901/g.45504 Transcript_20901/m.45504 type:complete len:630 (-) Transcript_20901:349-2238(-)